MKYVDGGWDRAIVYLNLEDIHVDGRKEEKINIMIQAPTSLAGSRIVKVKVAQSG